MKTKSFMRKNVLRLLIVVSFLFILKRNDKSYIFFIRATGIAHFNKCVSLIVKMIGLGSHNKQYIPP